MKKDKIPVVAIVGRTNVGKSTFFNALRGKRVSIVENESGVTRDRNYALINKDGFEFTLIDTGGLFADEELDQKKKQIHLKVKDAVKAQTELAIEEADVLIVMFDGLNGLHPKDAELANLIRKSEKKVIWVINKCEKPATQVLASEFYSLGIEDLIYISAEHRRGIRDITDKLKEIFNYVDKSSGIEEEQEFFNFDENIDDIEEKEEDAHDGVIKIAILGKPNVGKSTLVNKILGQERLVTSDVAGTTTDNIDVAFQKDGQDFLLIDTAGLRKKARVKDVTVERYGNIRTLTALARCDIAVLLLDATLGLPSEQDLKIASLIHERGRGLIIVVNKWDAIEKDNKTAKEFKEAVHATFRFTKYAPILFVSAMTGQRCLSILDKSRFVLKNLRTRIKTSDVNKLFSEAFTKSPPPVFRGEPVKLYFATQVKIAPPTFVLFVNHPRRIDKAYQRYLVNYLRDIYQYEGCAVKIILKKRTEKGNTDLYQDSISH